MEVAQRGTRPSVREVGGSWSSIYLVHRSAFARLQTQGSPSLLPDQKHICVCGVQVKEALLSAVTPPTHTHTQQLRNSQDLDQTRIHGFGAEKKLRSSQYLKQDIVY